MGERSVMVNMGQFAVSRSHEDVLTALGLGSCIAVCVYDPDSQLGGMVHVVLPDSAIGRPADTPAKFADSGVPWLIRHVEEQGATRRRLRISLVGGANVLTSGTGSSALDIGQRNITAVRSALAAERLAAVAEDVGGHSSRTVRLHICTGELMVKTLRDGEALFASLGGPNGRG
jgi:chemotaxis protein CheD